MKFKALAILLPVLLLLVSSAAAYAHEGKDGNSGSGGGGDENRVKVEVRANEQEPEEDRVRVEIRGENATVENALNLLNQQNLPDEVGRVRIDQRDDRVRVEVRAPEVEEEAEEMEVLPNVEIEDNTFEITGEVTSFTADTVTVAGQTITINPNAVPNFEQEGTIEVGEVIKVEGIIAADGSLIAREIKANGVEAEVEAEQAVGENSLTGLFSQVIAFLQSLV
ncbi:MAG: hypothetical protein HYT83_03390 [Candidatus Levybacteria bacterium]|nr:hypothetical protein [Candidatus Levybacteria bacterium]